MASGSAGDTGFVLSTDGSLTIGTTSLSFVAFTGASAVSAGNGLSKSGSTLSVKLNASTPGLVVDADGLTVKIKADSGVVKDADGLSVGLAALGGIGLVGGLLAVQVTEGVEIDGSGNLKINLDGGTLAQGADGLKVASDGISGAELAVRPRFDSFTGDGSTTVFTLANSVHANHLDGVKAFVNGMRVKPVASAPADEWEYVVADDEGDTIITFGAAPATGDLIFVDSISG